MTSSMKSLADCRPGKDLAITIALAMLGELTTSPANVFTYAFLSRLAQHVSARLSA